MSSPSTPLHEQTVNRLRDYILSVEVSSGDKLNERVLSQMFEVSRTPIREAFKVLAREGLIDIAPNKGASVSRVSRKEAEDAIFLIGQLEGIAGELACQHATESQIDHVTDLHKLLFKYWKARKLKEYFEINQQIHLAILVAANNQSLLESWTSLNMLVRRFRLFSNRSDERWGAAVKEHEMILYALQSRNGPVLKSILSSHIAHGGMTILKQKEFGE